MTYIVLARKYRPQNFDDLVGQVHVSQTLLNAIESGRTAHAYIFSGPRGVGKTTTARVLAKCLNCKTGPTSNPCNKCDACVAITEGTSMSDVLEIDGASNRGIEQIRELRESAKYAPRDSRYRIFIIDEAHQITKDAFGALLKTLEEPPAHVIFMMATTEVHKIPAPILSRCQRFSLRPIPPNLVLDHLKNICRKEKIKVEEQALSQIVRFVEGSLRDALSLLDQAVVFSPGHVTTETLRDLLGLLPDEVIKEFAKTIQAGDPARILQHVARSVQNGIDLTQLGKDLQHYYHSILLSKAGVNDISGELGTDYDFQTLERNIRLLSHSLDEMRRSETPRAVFEIYAMKLGQKTIDPRILVDKLEKLEKKPAASPEPGPAPVNRPSSDPVLQPKPVSVKSPGPAAAGGPQAQNSAAGLPAVARRAEASVAVLEKPQATILELKDNILSEWPSIVAQVTQQKFSLGSTLEEASMSVSNAGIVLTFSKAFHRDMIQRSLHILKPILDKRFNASLPIQTLLEERPASPNGEPARRSPPRADEGGREQFMREIPPDHSDDLEEISPKDVEKDIQKALDHFPGILKVEKRSP